MSVWGLK